MNQYTDRIQAGKQIAKHLLAYKNNTDTIVLALPRGGVPVAYEVAVSLNLPLDVFLVRKLGVPGHEELAFGAIASGEVVVFNESVLQMTLLDESVIESVREKEAQELKRREKKYRGNRSFPDLTDKTVILIDDGIATGATARAAISALQQYKPNKVILAVPVASMEAYEELCPQVDEFICPLKPENFFAVGHWYTYFPQTEDNEVIDLLERVNRNL